MTDPTFAPNELTVKLARGVSEIDPDAWNSIGGGANPFISHAFLSSLEDSGSVGPGTGWEPAPIIVTDAQGALLAAMPSYAKGHSQGEFVFDHSWADALQRAGGSYYPKLQIAAPFTPASGPRLLLAHEALAPHLIKGAEIVCEQNNFSSAHATFLDEDQLPFFEKSGWMSRSDIQFHWLNRDYQTFDDFLSDLSSRKRKNLRKERMAASENLRIERLTGDAIKPEHWDAFWEFYQDTGARKWGTPYLTRSAFELLGERMGNQIILILAFDDTEAVAGALNFVGADAIYGRYWGCKRDVKFLHFELCYYQAIEIAIELGLPRVEAGAQGGHKLARGYEPIKTWSAHWIANAGFRAAIADYLEREREGVDADQAFLNERTPFKTRG